MSSPLSVVSKFKSLAKISEALSLKGNLFVDPRGLSHQVHPIIAWK